ncbi:MAG: peptidase M23 [Bacteroidetes bacterium HGW-Bacteroidetes-1]|jgi:murein DD-endopeptidase MepM/ murein hydrolase activator NlpD|nr:MAG: peptidase M23 [Bacteroidetes bacterium HGW-Bacteroidetes-1]
MKQKKEKWYKKLSYKYRLVIFHDETFEEKISFRLSRMNVFVALVSLSVFLVVITGYIIAFTSLREYIPGYTDVTLNRRVYQLERSADSLEMVFSQKQVYFSNLRRIIEGHDFADDSINAVNESMRGTNSNYDTIRIVRSHEDSLLRLEFENLERFNLITDPELIPEARRRAMTVSNFFVPVKGTITNKFDPLQKHYAVDVVSKINEAVKSTLDGIVVLADWTPDKGYIIGVQHAGNFFSVYKHNSALLKQEGDFVRAGEPIAIIGESGEMSTGPHLHFELWYNATPVNPEEFISF